MALTLAAAGLYGAIAYGVAQRTREIGIRMALGATRAAVLRLVLGQGLRAVAIGLALGFCAAFTFAHSLTNYLTAALLMLLSATIACWLPARRATRVNPSDALRAE